MVNIIDTGPLVRSIKIGEESVPLTGVSFENLVPMLDRFPELKRVLTPSRGEVDEADFSFEGIVKLGPRIVAAILAAGMGKAGDAATEKMILGLGIGIQVKMLKEIVDMTFPDGLGPFVEDLRSLGLLGTAASGDGGKAQDTNSSSPSPSSTNGVTPKLKVTLPDQSMPG